MVVMSRTRLLLLTCLTMTAFAGNSLLCRVALRETGIDAASFTSIRLLSGALALWFIITLRNKDSKGSGSWLSALMLFAYAACFSFAYISLPAGTGALLLFGAVQATMMGYAYWTGERLRWLQLLGLVLAFSGLVGLLLPGWSAPPLGGSLMMMGAGIAWGVYSLRGKDSGDPAGTTAGNFLRSTPMAAVLSCALWPYFQWDTAGFFYAVVSGALASGLGYAIWYSVLPSLKATHASMVQLSVPVIAAVGGVALLGEPVTLRLMLASTAILGGIALVILQRAKTRDG